MLKEPVRCYAQMAIGGSMIFGLAGLTRSPSEPFTVTGGTGAFAGATGTGLAVSLSDAPAANTDVTITMMGGEGIARASFLRPLEEAKSRPNAFAAPR
jgi:hypothetical protein